MLCLLYPARMISLGAIILATFLRRCPPQIQTSVPISSLLIVTQWIRIITSSESSQSLSALKGEFFSYFSQYDMDFSLYSSNRYLRTII